MEKFNAVNEAVCFWLGYQFKIGRERLIHEASLRYPIADTITAKGIEINRIQLEKRHPYFADRLIDIIVYDKNAELIADNNYVQSVQEIYELKLAKQDTGNKYGNENQRIVDDLLRLAYFNSISVKDTYFLVCGRYIDFKNYFIGQKDEPKITKQRILITEKKVETNAGDNNKWNVENSLYKDYFDFRIGKSKDFLFTTNNIPENASKQKIKELEFGLTSFQSRYSITDDAFAYQQTLKVKTTCMSITPFEKITFRTHACGIWKVEALN